MDALTFNSDVQKESRMKPMWENLASFFMAAAILNAGLITYNARHELDAHCIPFPSRKPGYRNLTRAESDFVNSYCAAEHNHDYSSLATCTLLGAMAVWFVSNIWLLLPSVINSFRTFTLVREEIEKLGLSSEEMRQALQLGDASVDESSQIDKKLPKLEELRWIFWHFEGRNYAWKLYIIRLLSLFTVIAAAIGGSMYVHTKYFIETYLVCSLHEFYIHPFHLYFCSYSMPRKVKPYFLIIQALIVCQMLCVIVGLIMTVISLRVREQGRFTRHFQCTRRLIQFMKLLWKKSEPMKYGGYEVFLDVVMSWKYISDSFKKFLDGATTLIDDETLESYRSILSEKSIIGIASACYMAKRQTHVEQDRRDVLCRVLKGAYVSQWTSEMTDFANELILKKHWKLFVQLLDCKIQKPSDGLEVRLNLNDFRASEEEVLDYALDENLTHFTAARYIMKSLLSRPFHAWTDEQRIDEKKYISCAATAKLTPSQHMIKRLLEEYNENLKAFYEPEPISVPFSIIDDSLVEYPDDHLDLESPAHAMPTLYVA